MTEIHMNSINCNGFNVAYKDSGSGQPIVLLHNAGTDKSVWDNVTEILNLQFRVLQLDWPGYGDSELELETARYDFYAGVLRDFINTLELRNVTLVGNCLGAGVALEYCDQEFGKNIHAMVLTNVLTPKTLSATGRYFYHWAHSPAHHSYQFIRPKLSAPKLTHKIGVKYQTKYPSRLSKPMLTHLAKRNARNQNIQNLGLAIEDLHEAKRWDRLRKPDHFPPTLIL
jgi:pimeloyl-ACP methyl ester carboxylesterase